MKKVKKELFYTCILAKDKEHAKKIITFYKKAGFSNPYGLVGELADMEGVYYYTGTLFVDISVKKPITVREVELPIKANKKFPREMMVSCDNKNWIKVTALAKIKGQEYSIITKEPKRNEWDFSGWKYAKEID